MVIRMPARKTKKEAKQKPRTTKVSETSIVPAQVQDAPSPVIATQMQDFDRLLRAMNNRFANIFGMDPFAGFPSMESMLPSRFTDLRPAFSDIVDRGDSFVIHSELPGVKKEDVKITTNGDRVEISAETSTNTSTEGSHGAVYRERSQGKFFRAFNLADEVDGEKAEARFENGVLILTLPKKNPTPTKTRTVPVR
jgi:HSP20 family protein